MQRLLFQHTDVTKVHSKADRMLPGHGASVQDQAVNDDFYHDETSMFWLVISVLGNVIGGTLLFSSLILLPHVVARILG